MLTNFMILYGVTRGQWATVFVNSLAPGKFAWNFRKVIFKQILAIDGWGISCEIALIWMSLDFTDDQSTLVQAMAWCRQATSHYLSQCWPRSLSPYGVTRPQWVKPVQQALVSIYKTCKLSALKLGVSLCHGYIYGLVLERCNSSALAMELRLSCANPSI